jgi:site-specific recombinase XerD
MQRDPLLDEFFGFVEASSEAHDHKRAAKFDVTAAMTVHGITLAGLTPEALLFYGVESGRLRAAHDSRGHGEYAGREAWHFLHRMGHFPAAAPATMRAATVQGRRTVAEMIGQHQVRDPDVRDLLAVYVGRRAVDLDYPTVEALARQLAGLFWSGIEKISPAQSGLRLSEATYQQWKASVAVLPSGRPRRDLDAVLMAVRSFYLDLQSWAVTEPERWARWAAPCPVRDADLRGHRARRRRITERMADRTRERQPLLPALAAHADQRHRDLEGLLALAAATAPGDRLAFQGRDYRRTDSRHERTRARAGDLLPVRVTDQASGEVLSLTDAEEQAFWEWAIIETLRHSGIRIEELCELTHLSIRQHRRPNGEIAAVLVIAPSKTDRERVIPMSAELRAVIAAVIRRHQRHQAAVPLVRRYDEHERTWSEPLPFLFQRKTGTTRAVLSAETIRRMLRHACQALAAHRPELAGLSFSPHDFRRIFATDLVNSGLPIHIGAALLGHLSVQTTRGYVAVFDEDLVRHYQAFLGRRRALRPPEEYRPPTDAEWTEFEDHFDKRKVELGTCGRPYGTPCQHEHACIRCPVLHVDPRMLARLDEIEADLTSRRDTARKEGWHGEIEGLDLTLSLLRAKRDHTRRFTSRTHLGLRLRARPPG